ncbi:phage regulatory protein/antirepressor Ant [Leifsonia poae]|uniref:phage regulatory protein/antirepressor Ant n=1 Tax=Leifsonia poae TaxID=110933 RepID=UPI001CC00973|nr:phage regulatory protein/antirepressor Ant [Leifsonia poae]
MTAGTSLVAMNDGELTTTSQIIADGTGIEHASVLRTIDGNRADFEDFGPLRFEIREGARLPQGGFAKGTRIALLSESQATLLMTFMRNIGPVKAFKKALVKAFYELARHGMALPQTRAEALRELASQIEANEALEAKAALDAPKVLFADAVATSKTTVLVGELAKVLRGNGIELGQNRLFERLREDGYLIRRAGSDWNMPTQRAMELGLFEIKETAVTHSDGHVTVNKTPKVTGKGQAYFVNRYSA